MHSSSLRDTDFEIIASGKEIAFVDYFSGFTNTKRLGIVAPNRFEGVGAVNLIMAHATAFYNCYRATGENFFAYPDFFTFQSTEPKAAYGMFDIWPNHKDVVVGANSGERLDAITDRAINVLLVPEGQTTPREYTPVQLAAAARLIDTCYAYSDEGTVETPDLVIRCKTTPFADWVQSVFASAPCNEDAAATWRAINGESEFIEQSFRHIDIEEALNLL